MLTFQITSIPELKSFDEEQRLWILAEKGTKFFVEREDDGKRTKIREFEVLDNFFENDTTFTIKNNIKVSKLFLSATVNSGDLEITITSPFSDYKQTETLRFNLYDSFCEMLKDIAEIEKLKPMNSEERINEIAARLYNFSDKEKIKYSNRINENLQIFFDFQTFGELQNIDNWVENDNIEDNLNHIENKLKELIERREKQSLYEILKMRDSINETK